jgi:hypothetical protein
MFTLKSPSKKSFKNDFIFIVPLPVLPMKTPLQAGHYPSGTQAENTGYPTPHPSPSPKTLTASMALEPATKGSTPNSLSYRLIGDAHNLAKGLSTLS